MRVPMLLGRSRVGKTGDLRVTKFRKLRWRHPFCWLCHLCYFFSNHGFEFDLRFIRERYRKTRSQRWIICFSFPIILSRIVDRRMTDLRSALMIMLYFTGNSPNLPSRRSWYSCMQDDFFAEVRSPLCLN